MNSSLNTTETTRWGDKKREDEKTQSEVQDPKGAAPEWGSRSVDIFQKLEQIGEGTYGYDSPLCHIANLNFRAVRYIEPGTEKLGRLSL